MSKHKHYLSKKKQIKIIIIKINKYKNKYHNQSIGLSLVWYS